MTVWACGHAARLVPNSPRNRIPCSDPGGSGRTKYIVRFIAGTVGVFFGGGVEAVAISDYYAVILHDICKIGIEAYYSIHIQV